MLIENLPETTSTNNLKVLGSQNGSSVSYSLETLEDKINIANQSFGEGIQVFNPLNNYYPGQFVKYDEKLYKFIVTYPGGGGILNL